MKKLLLLPILAFLLPAAVFAAVVSGTVTNLATNQPQANQTVYIVDSTNAFSWNTTAVTNAAGQYSVTIPANVPNPSNVLVYTSACNNWLSNNHVYTGGNITSDFNICQPAPQSILNGKVFLGGSPSTTVAVGAKVYLIEKYMDSLTMNYMLHANDSTITNASGYYSFSTPNAPYSNLMVKAALPSSHASYANYLPTYYTNSLVWSGATALSSSMWVSTFNTNIYLQAGVNPGGPGFIGGSVLQGANKTTGVGDPLASRILILETAAGVPVAYTFSGANGAFSFPNLAYGSYKLHGDAWGKTNPSLDVTISAAKQNVSNITFQENSTTFKGVIGLGVTGTTATAVALFPNPAADVIRLQGVNGAVKISLYNSLGAIVKSADFADGQSAMLSVSGMPAGMYTAEVTSAAGTFREKIVKQ